MANEISQTLSVSIRNSKENANSPYQDTFSHVLTYDQTGIGAPGSHTATVTATEEDLWVGDISTPGLLILHNLDDTNIVKYGPKVAGTGTGTGSADEAVFLGRLKPGDVHKLQLEPGVTLRWRTISGTAKVDVKHYEA